MNSDELITVAMGQLGDVLGRGLLEILAEDAGLRVVDAGLDHAALLRWVERGKARVVVLDEDSAAVPSCARRLCAMRADVGLAVLAHRPTRAYATRIFSFGVSVCLSSDAPAPEIVRGVRLAAQGSGPFLAMSDRPASATCRALGISALTRRERQVLKLLSEGQQHAEIAEALSVGTETARTHAKHIYRKLGVSSRKELLGIEP